LGNAAKTVVNFLFRRGEDWFSGWPLNYEETKVVSRILCQDWRVLPCPYL
jgi:hypothetical protein